MNVDPQKSKCREPAQTCSCGWALPERTFVEYVHDKSKAPAVGVRITLVCPVCDLHYFVDAVRAADA